MSESNETQVTKPFNQESKRWGKMNKTFEAASASTGKERKKNLEKILRCRCGIASGN
ncbi:MAG: hypothetical protein K1X72_23680 [Pyrinomonadaceae bacterium]|nr:hypothetical protein [Pyrinomonadaceae bacterium]